MLVFNLSRTLCPQAREEQTAGSAHFSSANLGGWAGRGATRCAGLSCQGVCNSRGNVFSALMRASSARAGRYALTGLRFTAVAVNEKPGADQGHPPAVAQALWAQTHPSPGILISSHSAFLAPRAVRSPLADRPEAPGPRASRPKPGDKTQPAAPGQ